MAGFLSASQRRTLLAIARAALPEGRFIPAPTSGLVDKIERFIGDQHGLIHRGYAGLITAIDAYSVLRHRRSFAGLSAARQLEVLHAWQDGHVVRRTALRALITPLKVAHFDDPALYRRLGCVYRFDAVAEARPSWFTERSHDGGAIAEAMSLECDVVVVGTGAGGAVVAKELAEAGVAVVMLEEGAYFDRRHFAGRAFPAQQAMYRNAGATFSVGNVPIPIPIGKTVGGTTTINNGTCFRTPARVHETWRRELGLDELGADQMARYYDRVEKVLGVAPARAELLGGAARVIARGCDALGLKRHGPLRRNAPDCDGKGVCCFGCPTDAKRSTNVSYVPMALRAGAELFAQATVEHILLDGGAAVGVVARAAGGGRLEVRAKAVVISCGTLLTPTVLSRQHLGGASGQLGRNLTIHPAAACLAVFDEKIAAWDSIPQGYGIDEFHDEGLLFEGSTTPFEMTMSLVPAIGPRLIELAETFDKVASFGFLVEDSSRGTVRTIRGRTVVTYSLDRRDVAKIKRGIEILSRVFLAAGARSVVTPVHRLAELTSERDLARLRSTLVSARDLDLSAYHPLGTARMGRDPLTSVIDPDHRLHDVPGLYVVDGASVPSSLGVNPQVTIMAMATRAAEKIAAALA